MNKKKKHLSVIESRKLVSALIYKVLTEQLCVREAIKQFPSDNDDLSIQCAWHALVHYEADEQLRLEPNYANEQNDYLEMIANMLREGNPIPDNITESYSKYYTMAPLPHSKTFIGWLKSLLRFTI